MAKAPSSIMPSSPRGPVPVRLPTAAPQARLEPRVEPVDEGLLEGVQRRLREFVADLRRPEDRAAWVVIAALTGLLVFSYWPGLLNARSSWDNPQYSHGWLVPLCSLALVFWWRRPVEPVATSARLAGLALLLGGFLIRLVCAKYRIVTIDMYTFVPALAGVFLMAGGWSMFRWAWAPIAMLIFMYPLPDEATRYLLGPMQTLATMASTTAIQTLGLDAYREGNKIILNDNQVLGVVDACSGLRMLTIFVWLALMIVLVGGGEWWEKAIIAASAIPIALVVNAIRITVTAVMYTIDPETAEKIFHDWAGYFMMPMALAFLFLEQQVLTRLVVSEDATPTSVMAANRQAGVRDGSPAAPRQESGVPGRPASIVGPAPESASNLG
jgi:exosortase